MEKIYNKLVRDNIPEIIEKDGETAVYRVLETAEYKGALEAKLLEEAHEVIAAQGKEDTLEELADVLEVLEALAVLNGSNLEEVIRLNKEKAKKKGGFVKRLYLQKTIK